MPRKSLVILPRFILTEYDLRRLMMGCCDTGEAAPAPQPLTKTGGPQRAANGITPSLLSSENSVGAARTPQRKPPRNKKKKCYWLFEEEEGDRCMLVGWDHVCVDPYAVRCEFRDL